MCYPKILSWETSHFMRFCRNWVRSVSQARWFIGLGNPGVNLIVWPREAVSLEPGEPKFHITSALLLHCWPAQPRKYARITWSDWFHREVDSGSNFRPFSIPSVCEGSKFIGLGENQNYKSKIQILYPLWSLSQLKTTVSMKNCLDFCEISVSKQIWLKNQYSLFSKRFMGFVHLFEWGC